jgi:glycosyltransferase involved in cell wall biosynthesis
VSRPYASMRVLYVAQDDLSRNSGYAFRIDRLRKAIEAAGHEVRVIGFRSSEQAIACDSIRSVSRFRRLWPLMQGLARKSDCVVITSIGAPYNGVYSLLLRLLGRQVVYDCHDPVLASLPKLYNMGIFTKMLLTYVSFSEHLVGRLASETFSAGRRLAAMLRSGNPHRRVSIFYNIGRSAPLIVTRLGIRARLGWGAATILVYIGGLQREIRGLEPQIKAVERARSLGHDVRMLLVGFGDRPYFETLGKELIRQDALQILHDMPHEDLMALLAECDVAVSSDPWPYGMQSKMFDYLRSGVRIIAIDDDRDMVREFGKLLTLYDGSVDALAGILGDGPTRLTEAEWREGLHTIESMEHASQEAVLTAFARLTAMKNGTVK